MQAVCKVTWVMWYGPVALITGVGAESAVAAGRNTALGVATGSALQSLPETFRRTVAHVHLCLSEGQDDVFVRGVWKGVRTPTSVWTPLECRGTALGHSTYKDGATYVLVGHVHCLLDYLALIRRLVANNTINITKTLYLLVPTEAVNSDLTAKFVSSIPEKLNVVLLSLQISLEDPLWPRRASADWGDSEVSGFVSGRTDSTQRAERESRPHDGRSQLHKSRRTKRQNTASEHVSTYMGVQQTETTDHRNSSRTRQEANKGDTISSSSARLRVSLHVAESPGDGSVFFRNIGVWSWFSGLLLDGPLKATPSTNFYGRNLVMTTVYKPRVFEMRGPKDQAGSIKNADGYIAEVVRVLQRGLNFSAVLITTNTFGSQLANGSWNGLMGHLTRGEADVSPLDFSASLERAKVVDFSEWFSRDNVIIISQAPRPLQRPFLLLQIFSGWVWVMILMMGVSSGSILWALDYLIQRAQADRRLPRGDALTTEVHVVSAYLATVASTLKLFILQGSRIWCVSMSARVASSCVFLAVVSLVGVYQGFIVAFLAVPRRGLPIDSATDLIQRLDIVIPIVRKNTVYYQFVVKFESYRPIAAKLTFHQDEFINTWEFFQLIYQGKYALIDTYSSGVGRAAMFESRGEECHFHVSRQVLQPDLDLMAYRQNSVFRERIDLALRQLRSFGIIDKIKADFYSTSCERQLAKGNLDALSLIQMQSAFYVLVVGHLAALMGFVAEVFYSPCGRQKRELKASIRL